MPSVITPETHPNFSGREREFYDFWLANVTSPEDPHLQRWTDYEEGAVERALPRNDEIEQYEPLAGKRVLDVGCQNGGWLIALALAGADPVGIDTVPASIEAAKVRARCYDVSIDPRVGDACNLDFPSESFDVIASSCVIEHVPDKRAMVREVMRVLRPGGLALIKAPQRFSLKHLKSDPHYQYAGVSVLPASVASWYLTKFRGEAVYEVETLPTGRLIRKLFRQEGGIVLDAAGEPRSRPADVAGRTKSVASDLVDELRQVLVIAVRKPQL